MANGATITQLSFLVGFALCSGHVGTSTE
jgi:hypothetical protein